MVSKIVKICFKNANEYLSDESFAFIIKSCRVLVDRNTLRPQIVIAMCLVTLVTVRNAVSCSFFC